MLDDLADDFEDFLPPVFFDRPGRRSTNDETTDAARSAASAVASRALITWPGVVVVAGVATFDFLEFVALADAFFAAGLSVAAVFLAEVRVVVFAELWNRIEP